MSEEKLSPWQKYKVKNGVTILDAINPKTPHATEEESDRRYSICLECPELVLLTKQCKQCGCFMVAKTKLEAAKCPFGKW